MVSLTLKDMGGVEVTRCCTGDFREIIISYREIRIHYTHDNDYTGEANDSRAKFIFSYLIIQA